MAEWFEIKEDFIKWLKTQDVDFNENDKEYAPIKYSKQFKLFIEKHDGDENLNMDSFTKRDTQHMVTDNIRANRLEEEQAALKENEKEKGHLIEDMLKDYIADLDKNDEVFQAIDGILGVEKDGEISNAERNMFIQQATLDGFDKDNTDFSFDDLINSVKKIKGEDVVFLNENAQLPNANLPENPEIPQVPGLRNNNPKTDIEKVNELSKITQKYEPTTIENKSLSLNSIKTPKVNSMDFDTSNLKNEKTNTTNSLNAAKTDFNNFAIAYDTTCKTIDEASGYIEANQAQYDKVMQNLEASNTHVKEANEQISTFENTIEQTNNALDAQYATKDKISMTIVGLDSEISSLQSQMNSIPSDAEDASARRAAIQARINELESQKDDCASQLLKLEEEILANKELLDETSQALDLSYANLKTALENVEFSDENSKEIVLSTLENKKVLAQAQNDKSSAHAGMVAMDSYIEALEVRLENINEAINASAQEEAEPAQETTQQNPAPKGVAGLSEATVDNIETDEKSGASTYTYSVNGSNITVTSQNTENGLELAITTNGATEKLTINNGNLSHKSADGNTLYKRENNVVSINNAINITPNENGGFTFKYSTDNSETTVNFEPNDKGNRVNILRPDGFNIISQETDNESGTTKTIQTTKDDEIISSYSHSLNAQKQITQKVITNTTKNEDGSTTTTTTTYDYSYENGTPTGYIETIVKDNQIESVKKYDAQGKFLEEIETH
ncbi:MAG: hypothetical protein IJW73_03080 [Candidatus Gastranaerophilales bacterium]|nr:hypothetical protein [Candidatus Gastranaerophilales bacterium]